MTLDRKGARERCDAATEGPWQATTKKCKFAMNSYVVDREGDPDGVGIVAADLNQANAELYATDADMDFIAAARTDLSEALDLLDECEDVLNKAIEDMLWTFGLPCWEVPQTEIHRANMANVQELLDKLKEAE